MVSVDWNNILHQLLAVYNFLNYNKYNFMLIFIIIVFIYALYKLKTSAYFQG